MNLLDYVNPREALPEVKGSGKLLIVGTSACVWEDLERYELYHGEQDRMGINDMMNYYPGLLQHGVSLDTEQISVWRHNQNVKRRHQRTELMKTHSHYFGINVDYVWPFTRDGGTSGLFAVFVGLFMGYSQIILAGLPYDGSQNFFEPPDQNHVLFSSHSVQEEWLRAIGEVEIIGQRVRSLSGNTAKWLGEPDMTAPIETVVQEAAHPIHPKKTKEVISINRRSTPVTVITPTGDRPEAIQLLRRWIANQTRKPDQWLVIDDGKVPLPKIHEAQVVRRDPLIGDDPCTLGANLKHALPHIKHDKILIMEDDDWYASDYIEVMTGMLSEHSLVGISGTKCYHIQVPGYRLMGRYDHASLSQTGLRKSRLQELVDAIPGDCQVDLRLWHNIAQPHGHLIDGNERTLHCAIKGLPGRAGAGVGHLSQYHTRDQDYEQLKKWCFDWQAYVLPFSVRDRLVIYSAIAKNGLRDDEPLEPDPIGAVDYVMFTDLDFKSDIWEVRPFDWRHVKEAVRTAKRPKVLPHIYFLDYDLSVWVDGNIRPRNSVEQATKQYLVDHDLAIHSHPWRKGVYEEAEVVMGDEKDDIGKLKRVMEKYKKQGMPAQNGLYECGILFRRHNKPEIARAMMLWWTEICRGTQSDQIPWSYVVWKMQLKFNIINGDLRESPYFDYAPHDPIQWGKIICS